MATISRNYGVLGMLLVLPMYVIPSYPHALVAPSYPNPAYVPAMPGKTPKCAKDPSLTFCLYPKYYPKERIIYLLENKMYDVETFLQDETRDTLVFEAREMRPAPHSYGGNSYPAKGYLPPSNTSSSSYFQNRPSKFGNSHHLKPPLPAQRHPSHLYLPPNTTTPSLNSFSSSYPNKYVEPRHYNYNNRGSTPRGDSYNPYPRYSKNLYRTTSAPYQPPQGQHMWWRKNIKRQKRQTNLQELCPSRSEFITPRAAQSVEGDWYFVVNVDQRYQQLVKKETCIQNTCEGSCDVPEGFSAICQQLYVQKRLVSLDNSGSKLNYDTFWFPSCCVCRVRPNIG